MARVFATVTSGEVALNAATSKTVLRVDAAANHRIALTDLSVMFKGTSVTQAPVRIRLMRQTTAGTGTSVTPVKQDEGDNETIQTTSKKNFSAEPTYGDVLREYEINPQTGMVLDFAELGDEPIVIGGGNLAVVCLADDAQTVNVTMGFEE